MPWVDADQADAGTPTRAYADDPRDTRGIDIRTPVREPGGQAVPVSNSEGQGHAIQKQMVKDTVAPAGASNTIPGGHWADLPEEPGYGESAVRGGLQGITLGHSDEIGGGLQAVIDRVTGDKGSLSDLYHRERDAIRQKNAAAAQAHPYVYHGAEIAAGLALPVPGAEEATLARLAAAGAGYGALAGVGYSDAQGAGDLAKAGLLGAAGGAAAGGLGYAAGKALTSAPVTGALDAAGIHAGRTHLQGGMGRMVGSAKYPVSEDAVRAAEAAGAFGGKTVQGSLDTLEAAQNVAGDAVQAHVQNLTERGVRSTNLRALAQHWSDQADLIESRTMGSPVAELMRRRSAELLSKLPEYAEVQSPEDLAALEQFAKDQSIWQQRYNHVIDQYGGAQGASPAVQATAERFAGPRPTPPEITHAPTYKPAQDVPLAQGEQLKSSLQDRGNKSLIDPAASTEADRQMGMDLRLGNEQAIGQQAGPEALGQYQNAKQAFGNLEEARAAAEKGAARYQNRPAIGLYEMGAVLSGHPMGAVGTHLLRTRGYSAAASGLMGTAKMLSSMATTAPRALGKYAAVLQRAAQSGGDDAVAQKHFVLQATDPQYRQMVARIRAEQGNEDGGR